jgi:hypothetical protein
MFDAIWRFFRGRQIHITIPRNDDGVAYKDMVYGTALDEMPNLRVWVYSNDGLWYPQRPKVLWDGLMWSQLCTFGYANSYRRPFKVVAMDYPTLDDTPLAKLPKHADKSKSVVIFREDGFGG